MKIENMKNRIGQINSKAKAIHCSTEFENALFIQVAKGIYSNSDISKGWDKFPGNVCYEFEDGNFFYADKEYYLAQDYDVIPFSVYFDGDYEPEKDPAAEDETEHETEVKEKNLSEYTLAEVKDYCKTLPATEGCDKCKFYSICDVSVEDWDLRDENNPDITYDEVKILESILFINPSVLTISYNDYYDCFSTDTANTIMIAVDRFPSLNKNTEYNIRKLIKNHTTRI